MACKSSFDLFLSHYRTRFRGALTGKDMFFVGGGGIQQPARPPISDCSLIGIKQINTPSCTFNCRLSDPPVGGISGTEQAVGQRDYPFRWGMRTLSLYNPN